MNLMRARDVTSQVFLLGTNAENDPIAGKTSDMAGYADDGTLRRNRICGLQERRLILLGPWVLARGRLSWKSGILCGAAASASLHRDFTRLA
jgi:hypothetical protein